MDYIDYTEDLEEYKDFRPTGFDRKGAFIHDDRRNWKVAPVGQTRDSNIIEKSNFENFLEEIGGESEDVEVLRFGHWGPGWFEIIIINPNNIEIMKKVGKMICALSDYPILNDDDYYEKEWEATCEYWENLPLDERIEYCAENNISIFAARRDEVPRGLYSYHFDIC